MKKITFILLSILILNSGFKFSIDTSSKMKAIFIMNFTKLVEWPQSYKKGSFIIGVIGNSPLYNELSKMSKTKKIANQSILIKKFNNINDINKCHILYVSENKSDDINSIVKQLKRYNTLVVTEGEGLVKAGGVGINFIVKNNRQKFELNQKSLNKFKLKFSANLAKLAYTVR